VKRFFVREIDTGRVLELEANSARSAASRAVKQWYPEGNGTGVLVELLRDFRWTAVLVPRASKDHWRR
jgi:hypothetical protein